MADGRLSQHESCQPQQRKATQPTGPHSVRTGVPGVPMGGMSSVPMGSSYGAPPGGYGGPLGGMPMWAGYGAPFEAGPLPGTSGAGRTTRQEPSPAPAPGGIADRGVLANAALTRQGAKPAGVYACICGGRVYMLLIC